MSTQSNRGSEMQQCVTGSYLGRHNPGRPSQGLDARAWSKPRTGAKDNRTTSNSASLQSLIFIAHSFSTEQGLSMLHKLWCSRALQARPGADKVQVLEIVHGVRPYEEIEQKLN